MNQITNNIYNGLELLPVDVTGWNFKHDIFNDLVKQTMPKVIIEVGTWKGGSAIKMANYCKQLRLDTKIYCVDTWLGAYEFWTYLNDTDERDLMLRNGYPQVYYQFLSNVVHSGVKDFIYPVPLPSSTGWKVLEYLGVKADLIYIDGSHEYDDVKADILNYRKLLTDKGVIFGDDYGWEGVRNAVNDSFSYADIDVIDQNFWVKK